MQLNYFYTITNENGIFFKIPFMSEKTSNNAEHIDESDLGLKYVSESFIEEIKNDTERFTSFTDEIEFYDYVNKTLYGGLADDAANVIGSEFIVFQNGMVTLCSYIEPHDEKISNNELMDLMVNHAI